ncbi:hypothetical protein [Nocardia transvalensis]|uniref:hypothetical protein n=1 Tax=Nocardia transvalensis TaxID=37333 RepID=UPI001892D4E2|nr:hypothetical protein [Nocardia transvalensis]MBF6330252.1 hypothetical protein [Nocardia transvalensis]
MSEPTAQGEIWTVRTISGQEYSAVVADADMLARSRPTVMAARVSPTREVPSALELLTVPLSDSEVVAVYSMATIPRTAFVELKTRLTGEQLERLKVALRARFDL